MKKTITIQEIIKKLRRRFRLILAITMTAALLSGGISYFLITPVYDASTELLINQRGNESFTHDDIEMSRDLVETYSVIITSPRILDEVVERTEAPHTSSELRGQTRVSGEEESQIVKITVEDENHAYAVELVNTISEVFIEDLPSIMNVDNVSVLSMAELRESPSPVAPSPVFNTVIAFMIGFMVSIGLVFLLDVLDTKLRTEEDVETRLGIPVLASISSIQTSKHGRVKDPPKVKERGSYGA